MIIYPVRQFDQHGNRLFRNWLFIAVAKCSCWLVQ